MNLAKRLRRRLASRDFALAPTTENWRELFWYALGIVVGGFVIDSSKWLYAVVNGVLLMAIYGDVLRRWVRR